MNTRPFINVRGAGAAVGLWALLFAAPVYLLAQTVPTIDSVPGAAARSERVKIAGTGFGAAEGTVMIGASKAIVSRWTDTLITIYVPETTALGVANLQVMTPAGGGSNSVPLTVTAREASAEERVRWRFKGDGHYFSARPAVGRDGTVYALDNQGVLYALAPNGGLKWLVARRVGNANQPVAIDAAGTIYFANGPTVYAIDPNGTEKWRFTNPTFYRIFAGPSVGPDGNIYAATEEGASPGLGLFALSPQGGLLWNKPGFNTRGGYGGIDIVFSPSGQYYFTSNASGAVLPAGGLFAYQGKTQRWNNVGIGQPRLHGGDGVVAGDGNPVHPGLVAYDAAGNLRWRALTEGTTPIQAQTAIAAAPDGTLYVGTLTYGTGRHLTSLGADGSLRWQYFGNGIMSVPAVNPANTLVLVGAYQPGAPGWVDAVRTDGNLAWRLNLPADNGAHVWAMAAPVFSADGGTAYVGMTGNNYAPDIYAYFYAIDAGDAPATVDAPDQPADEPTVAPAVALASLGGSTTVLGGTSATWTLTLAAAAPAGGITIALASTNPAVTVPATIKVAQGATKVKFPIATSLVASRQTGQITATSGSSTVSRSLTVRPIGVRSVVLTPSTVRGGGESVATITLEAPAAPGDIAVKVTSSKAAAVPANATLVIPAGGLTATTTVKTSAVPSDLVVTIKATANGVTKSAKLTLTR